MTILIPFARLLSDYLDKKTLIIRLDGRRCIDDWMHCIDDHWRLVIVETSTCVLSNSGLSNATSKRPKLAFFREKICPPQSQNCQNQILDISKINFYFGFSWYSRYSQCRLVIYSNSCDDTWINMASAIGKLEEIGIRTPLKLYVYFWFVS